MTSSLAHLCGWCYGLYQSVLQQNPDHVLGRYGDRQAKKYYGLHSFRIWAYDRAPVLGSHDRWSLMCFRVYGRHNLLHLLLVLVPCSQRNFQGRVSFQHVGPQGQTQVMRSETSILTQWAILLVWYTWLPNMCTHLLFPFLWHQR